MVTINDLFLEIEKSGILSNPDNDKTFKELNTPENIQKINENIALIKKIEDLEKWKIKKLNIPIEDIPEFSYKNCSNLLQWKFIKDIIVFQIFVKCIEGSSKEVYKKFQLDVYSIKNFLAIVKGLSELNSASIKELETKYRNETNIEAGQKPGSAESTTCAGNCDEEQPRVQLSSYGISDKSMTSLAPRNTPSSDKYGILLSAPPITSKPQDSIEELKKKFKISMDEIDKIDRQRGLTCNKNEKEKLILELERLLPSAERIKNLIIANEDEDEADERLNRYLSSFEGGKRKKSHRKNKKTHRKSHRKNKRRTMYKK